MKWDLKLPGEESYQVTKSYYSVRPIALRAKRSNRHAFFILREVFPYA
jgi:hypothetical protein